MYAVVVCLWKLNESELFFVCARGRYRALLNCAHVYIIAIAIEYLPFIANTWKMLPRGHSGRFATILKYRYTKGRRYFCANIYNYGVDIGHKVSICRSLRYNVTLNEL